MGKPFASELENLPTTYSWALNADISQLEKALINISSFPLLAVGSGGSYTTAYFISQLHEDVFRQSAKAVTPLELAGSEAAYGKAVVLISAGGRNPDIVGALKRAIQLEVARIVVVCFKKNSPLARLASAYRNIELIEFELPSGRDGFLATNSLLAFNLLALRSYFAASSRRTDLPKTLRKLLDENKSTLQVTAELREKSKALWDAKTIIILHGLLGAVAAIDLESKFTEAALGVTQIADLRNFAHGRHHWLAKHGDSSAILTLVTPNDAKLTAKTVDQIPKTIPNVMLSTSYTGFEASIALNVAALYLTRVAGEAKGIDPGRPGVPPFGSKIYRLNAFGEMGMLNGRKNIEDIAICRKSRNTIEGLSRESSLGSWKNSFSEFLQKIQSEKFRSVVFDYDGTLCDEKNRFDGVDESISGHLKNLLEAGIHIGIATGRGKSVRNDLRNALPKKYWSGILIGYYNGAEIGAVDDDTVPDASTVVGDALVEIADLIKSEKSFKELCEITYRKSQITIVPKSKLTSETIWGLLQEKIQLQTGSLSRSVRSSHSFDVIPQGVSKRALVLRLAGDTKDSSVLCIGDRGSYPGNDFELLQQPFSLSCDEVSFDPQTCWNFAPAGMRGVQATEHYLRSLTLRTNSFKFRLHR